MNQSGMIRWWLVRHAPVINPGGAIYGRRDLDCDVTDTERVQATASRLPQKATWLVSPLKRTHQTARAIGGDPKALTLEPDLIEQDFGDWQGMSHDQIAKERPEESRRFWLAPAELAPPGGESFAALCARVGPMLERRSAECSAEIGTGDIIAVCHGGTIRAAVAHALELSPATSLRIKVDTLSLTCLERYPDGAWAVGSVNRI